MYLVLGSPYDPCCAGVHAALAASGRTARIIANPLAHPARFSWRLDEAGIAHAWMGNGLRRDDIEGVLVRSGGWLDPEGWQPQDLGYMQAEVHAALLAWLRSLPCPVINRYAADLWYRPQPPLLAWRRLLRTCGLTTPAAIVSNVERGTRAFGQRYATTGVPGAAYTPLTGNTRYLVATDDEWRALAAVQRQMPVCLARPHAAPVLACVVGTRVIWCDTPSWKHVLLESALRHFAEIADLTFVELALAPVDDELCVVAVDHRPQLERYAEAARREIVGELTRALTSAEAAVETFAAREVAS